MSYVLILCLVCHWWELTSLHSRNDPVVPLPPRQLVPCWGCLWGILPLLAMELSPTCPYSSFFPEPTQLCFSSFQWTTLEPNQSLLRGDRTGDTVMWLPPGHWLFPLLECFSRPILLSSCCPGNPSSPDHPHYAWSLYYMHVQGDLLSSECMVLFWIMHAWMSVNIQLLFVSPTWL